MRIWRDGKAMEMSGYSLVENLLRSLINRREHHSPPRDASALSPEERLVIVRMVEPDFEMSGLAQLHLDCHCFAEAYEGFLEMRHHRKLGDVAWAMGNFEIAASHYLDTSFGFQSSYRKEPDYDRLVRLAFVSNNAEAFFRWFDEAGFDPGNEEESWINGSATNVRPFLAMFAILWRTTTGAVPSDAPLPEMRGKGVDETRFLEEIEDIYGMEPEEWRAFAEDPRFALPTARDEAVARCLPIPCRHPPVTLEAAMKEGDTGRARHFAETIRNVDRLVDESQDALERFRDHGREEDLEIWADRVGRFGAEEMTETVIFTSLGHHSYEAAPELQARLRKVRSRIKSRMVPREGPAL